MDQILVQGALPKNRPRKSRHGAPLPTPTPFPPSCIPRTSPPSSPFRSVFCLLFSPIEASGIVRRWWCGLRWWASPLCSWASRCWRRRVPSGPGPFSAADRSESVRPASPPRSRQRGRQVLWKAAIVGLVGISFGGWYRQDDPRPLFNLYTPQAPTTGEFGLLRPPAPDSYTVQRVTWEKGATHAHRRQEPPPHRYYFVVHIGPPKTATTTLQMAMTRPLEDSTSSKLTWREFLLQNDQTWYDGKYDPPMSLPDGNYHYNSSQHLDRGQSLLGVQGPTKHGPLLEPLTQASCQHAVHQARIKARNTAQAIDPRYQRTSGPAQSTEWPPCWQEFDRQLEQHRHEHILISEEALSYRHVLELPRFDQAPVNDTNFGTNRSIAPRQTYYSTSIDWIALQEFLQRHAPQHELLVVVGYRRWMEWFPSAKQQRDRCLPNRKKLSLWPQLGGKRLEPLLPAMLRVIQAHRESNTTDRWSTTTRRRRSETDQGDAWNDHMYAYTDQALQSMPSQIPVRLLRVRHGTSSLLTHWFCEVLPMTSRACQQSRQQHDARNQGGRAEQDEDHGEERDEGAAATDQATSLLSLSSSSSSSHMEVAASSPTKTNTASLPGPLEPNANPTRVQFYDALVVQAADQGWIQPLSRYKRPRVAEEARQYQRWELNRTDYDFVLDCPTEQQLDMVRQASWQAEVRILGGREPLNQSDHDLHFEELVARRKFCWINSTATLLWPEWQAFFEKYHKSP